MKSKLRKCQFWKFPWEMNFVGRENCGIWWKIIDWGTEINYFFLHEWISIESFGDARLICEIEASNIFFWIILLMFA